MNGERNRLVWPEKRYAILVSFCKVNDVYIPRFKVRILWLFYVFSKLKIGFRLFAILIITIKMGFIETNFIL